MENYKPRIIDKKIEKYRVPAPAPGKEPGTGKEPWP